MGHVPLAKEYIVRDKDGIPLEWKKGSKYPVTESYALAVAAGRCPSPSATGRM